MTRITIEELDEIAKAEGHVDAHWAVLRLKDYQIWYSEYLHRCEDLEKVLFAVKEIVPKELSEMIDNKLK